jgi:TldD protein
MIAALLLAAAPVALTPPADDQILKVLADEVQRAMTMKMPAQPGEKNVPDKPYYVRGYATTDTQYSVWANFGAQAAPSSGTQIKLGTAVRVGSPDLDNTNFQGGAFAFGFDAPARVSHPAEPDLDAIRRALWLSFDSDYKKAVEAIARKRAYLETNQVKDRLPDFGPATAEKVFLPPEAPPKLDLEKWGGIAKRTSASCKAFASPHTCIVGLNGRHGCQRFVASDGAMHRFCETRLEVYITAQGQAQDGMPVSSDWHQAARTEGELPTEADITAKVKEMGEQLEKKLKSQAPVEDYAGPVLFTGDAAPAFFLSALSSPLSQPRESLGASEQGRMIERLGKHIAVSQLSATDDPTQMTWTSPAGKVLPLFGYFAVDDDGVKPQPITLVKDGVLQTYYMSRLPTKRITKTNGHARNDQGSTGNLFISTKEPHPLSELKKKLVELAKEEDLDYGLVVAKLPQAWESRPDTSLKLPNNPLLIYKVYADGHEEQVRGLSFKPTTFRVLKDIVMMGDDPTLLNSEQFGQQVSAVAPSTLVKLLELNKPRDEYGKPPVLARPALSQK